MQNSKFSFYNLNEKSINAKVGCNFFLIYQIYLIIPQFFRVLNSVQEYILFFSKNPLNIIQNVILEKKKKFLSSFRTIRNMVHLIMGIWRL